MDIIAEANDKYVLRVSSNELRLIVGIMREVCFAVPDFEFEARLGWSPDAAKALARHVQNEVARVGLEL